MKAKAGRPANAVENKIRHIRLTDEEWKIFKEKLGPDWLRKQIQMASGNTDQ